MTKHASIPEDAIEVLNWLEPVVNADKHLIASRVTLAGLDGFKGTMTADQQRRLFGRKIFGKKYMEIDATNGGAVKGYWKTGFGHDWEEYTFSFDRIAMLVNTPTSRIDF